MSPDVAASVRARLLNHAKARGEEFERTLARFAGERLLFRLGACAARDRCILKDASLLAVWMPDPYRATRDVDVLSSLPARFGDIGERITRFLGPVRDSILATEPFAQIRPPGGPWRASEA